MFDLYKFSGYLKFFGAIAHNYPNEFFERHAVVLSCLFEAFDSRDSSLLPVALDTLGFIGSTIEGKLCLAALGKSMISTEDLYILYQINKKKKNSDI